MEDMPMQAGGEEPGEAQEQGGASKIVVGISDMLGKLAAMFDQSPAVTDKDKAMLAEVVTKYQKLADSLGGNPGEDAAEEQPAGPAPVPEHTMGKPAVPAM